MMTPALLLLLACVAAARAQGGLTLSTVGIHSKVEAADNWSPPTAVGGRKPAEGTSTGYGAALGYSFRPAFLTRNPRILLHVGAGYFVQRFDLRRPFDYLSPLKPIFYTDHYTYRCWQGSAGATYNHPLGKKYFLSAGLAYTWLRSFRQEYTPVSNHGYGELTQTTRRPINFGKLLTLSAGIRREFGGRLSAGLDLLAPLYTRWRNDRIFKDDPTTFSRPGLSLGVGVSVACRLKKNAGS